jgi:uncharacterized repeat protein (TIGR02543 family)
MKPKRAISLLLAGCMAVSMVPASAVTAFAEEVRTGSSLTAPATVKVEVTLDGTQSLEDAVKAQNQDLASITELKVITTGSAALTKADFQFMSGVVVSETENGRFSSVYTPDNVTCLKNLKELDLSQATCENNAIPPRAFQRNTAITKIVLPDNLERTYIHAFSMMSALTYLGTTNGNLQFPSSMKIMGEGMVYQDEQLSGTLTFPANLEAIGSACFYDSGISGKVVIPANVNITTNTDIDSEVYKPSDNIFRKSKITSLEFENGVEEISKSFAHECTELTSVILPKTVKKIDASAFQGTNLSTLPNLENVTEIGDSAFRELKSEINGDLTLSNGVTYGDSVFRGLKLNGNLTIDSQNIGDYILMESDIKGNLILGCATVPKLILSRADNTYNGESVIGGHLTLKPGVTTIMKEAFNGAGLTGTLTIPEGVTTIGESAFRCNQFSGTIVIPESVESIGRAAFSYAGGGASTNSQAEAQNSERKIENIIVENPNVTLGQYAFSNQKDGVKIYFASDSAPENPNSMYWSSGESIVLLTDGGKIDPSKPADEKTGLFTPEKEGYTFAGWYNADGNELETAAVKNNTYTAKWSQNASMDAETDQKGDSQTATVTVGKPIEVTVTVNPGDNMLAILNGKARITFTDPTAVESLSCNGKTYTGKDLADANYTLNVSDLMPGSDAGSSAATYAATTAYPSAKLSIVFNKKGNQTVKIQLLDSDDNLLCESKTVVAVEEEKKPEETKPEETKPENPVTTYALTVKGGTVKVNDKDAVANDGVIAVEKDATVEVTFDKSTLSDAQVFDQWTITPDSVLNAVDPKAETISFKMPAEKVTVEAMTKDATIEDDGPDILGTAALIGVGVAGTAVLGYQGYMIGTELYLNTVLPDGVAIPQNTAELAKLVWTEAGKPAPAAVMAPDATDEQKALTWAIENQLISADKAADASVSRWEVIQTWNKAQEMKG